MKSLEERLRDARSFDFIMLMTTMDDLREVSPHELEYVAERLGIFDAGQSTEERMRAILKEIRAEKSRSRRRNP